LPQKQVRTCLNGLLIQERNNITDTKEDLKPLPITVPTEQEIKDLILLLKFVKHKSNTIVFAKNGTPYFSGTGQNLELML
jgi:phosphoribosylaminoimidazolecarboxamide formyltransferase/IMP cyclohydrolase